MKYSDFYLLLRKQTAATADIGPSISIDIGPRRSAISMSNTRITNNHRFLVFPIKIYGHNIHHLNVLVLDRKTKIAERYEPFNQHVYFTKINQLLESLLYKLRETQKIYFLKYTTTLNNTPNLKNKNCAIHCLQHLTNNALVSKYVKKSSKEK